MVLNEMSDDYENVDQIILPNVARDGAKLGLVIERSEIVTALAGLVKDGLAKAYNLWQSNEPLEGMPRIDLIDEELRIYFYITKQGMDQHLSDDTWWPFDDDGELKQHWRLDPS